MAMFLGGIIWSAVAKDYNSLLGSRVFASFGKLDSIFFNFATVTWLIIATGYGAIESLGPSILAGMPSPFDNAGGLP